MQIFINFPKLVIHTFSNNKTNVTLIIPTHMSNNPESW